MVAAASGIATSMAAITLYRSRAGQLIPWKNDTLYAVTLDARGNEPPRRCQRHPEYPPFQVTYMDARALHASTIPVHSVMMHRLGLIAMPQHAVTKPFAVDLRVTTADFFATFDAPFRYGSAWLRAADDDGPAAVVVLSKHMSQKLSGG